MSDAMLHTMEWSETEELRVGINEYQGRKYFAVRVWFMGRDGKEFFPGKQGINVPVEKADQFMSAIIKGKAALDKLTAKGKKGGKR